MTNFGRPILDRLLVESFVINVLMINTSDKNFDKICDNILSVEMQLNHLKGKDTLNTHNNRNGDYRDESVRLKLREKILDELISKKRLINDDNIKLGSGGALPRTPKKRENKAFFVIGLPASGKSMVTNLISDEFGAIIIDSDYAKRKFPEYKNSVGATLLHEESAMIINGDKNTNGLINFAIESNYNIVIPKVGSNYKSLLEQAEILALKYEIHLVLVRLDRTKAVARAYNRFRKTNRYVPLPLVFDQYGNKPTIVYYDMKSKNHDLFKSFTCISSDVPFGHDYKIFDKTKDFDWHEKIIKTSNQLPKNKQ